MPMKYKNPLLPKSSTTILIHFILETPEGV